LILEIALIVLLIVCSGFFSGSETALFSLSQIKLRPLQTAKDRRKRLIPLLLSKPRHLLITILIGNMMVNILASSVSASLFRKLTLHSAEAFSVLTMTMLILVFGEIAPKTFSIQRSEMVARVMAPAIRFFSIIVSPLRVLLWSISDVIIRLVAPRKPIESGITEKELMTAMALGLQEGVLEKWERDMIHGVLEIESKQVRDMMKPRMELFALPVDTPVKDVCEAIRRIEYTRIPIYEEALDELLGILHAKDLLYADPEQLQATGLRKILRPAFFVPETMPIDKLLQEFRQRRTHFALVVDEYGSISGLITLEDVLEMIVGHLDITRFETKHYHLLEQDKIRISGQLSIDKFNQVFGCNLKDEFSVTMGGFLTHQMGKIPAIEEALDFDNLSFKATRARKNRVEEIVVTRIKQDKDHTNRRRQTE